MCLLNLVQTIKQEAVGEGKVTHLESEDLVSASDSLWPQANPFPVLYTCVPYTLGGEGGAKLYSKISKGPFRSDTLGFTVTLHNTPRCLTFPHLQNSPQHLTGSILQEDIPF